MTGAAPRSWQFGRLMWRGLLGLCAVALALVVSAAVGLGWALHDPQGSGWLLRWVPGLKVVSPQGPLLGDAFKASRLEVSLPRGGRLVMVEPAWSDLSLSREPNAAWQLGLHVASLSARSVSLQWVAAPGPSSTTPPTQLDLPVAVRIDRLKVARFTSNLLEPEVIEQLDASVRLQASAGTSGAPAHSVTLAHLEVAGWTVSGQGSLVTRGQMAVSATLQAQQLKPGDTLPVGRALLTLNGPLAKLAASGEVGLRAMAGGQEQTLSWQGDLQPFESWPISRLDVRARDLDLARVWPHWPQTRLNGLVKVIRTVPTQRPGQATLPARLHALLDVSNVAAGRWDQGLVPVSRLLGDIWLDERRGTAQSAAVWGRRGSISLQANLVAAQAKSAVPVLRLDGPWNLDAAEQTSLQARLSDVALATLDSRAPALQVRGDVNVKPAATQQGAPDWQALSVTGQLTGSHLDEAGRAAQAVQANVHLSWASRALQVHQVTLRSGPAQARLSGVLQLPENAPWVAKGVLSLSEFDPRVWLPPAGLPEGAYRLQGDTRFQVDALLHGQADGRLTGSQLAGVPLDGQWNWSAPAQRADMQLQAQWRLGGNQFALEGSLPLRRSASGVDWSAASPLHGRLKLQAPALATLQPLARWAGWTELQGQVQADLGLDGVWPTWRTQGLVSTEGLTVRSPAHTLWQLGKGQATWSWQMAANEAPVAAQLSLADGRVGALQVSQLSAQLSGTGAQHRLAARGDVKVTMSSASQAGGAAVRSAHIDWLSQGGWIDRGGLGWSGRIQQLKVATLETAPRMMFESDGMPMSWLLSDQQLRAQIQPASVSVMGAALRIQDVSLLWPRQGRGIDSADVNLALGIEPFKLAEVLARWQPQAGWGGDLTVAGTWRLQHHPGEAWRAEGFLARQAGDLSLSEPTIQGNTRQALGIKQARIDLSGQQGVWRLTQQFDGRVLGTLSGEQVVRSRDPLQLPGYGDALSGGLDVRIANMRPWGVWMPAGWRLGGQLQAQAAVAGTLGQPRLTGAVKGQGLSLAHALMGVNVTDGVLDMSLEGDHIHLKQLTAHGAGEQGGSLTLTGEASLGAQEGQSPQASVNLQAERFALLQRVDRRARVSGQGQLRLGAEDLNAVGKFTVDEGLIDISRSDAPTLGDDVNVVNRPGDLADSGETAAANGNTSHRKLLVNLELDLGSKLRLKGRGLDTQLQGNLKLSTQNGKPLLHGVVRTVSGKYAAYGQKLNIERGTITFSGLVENPRLDILAMRPDSPSAAQAEVKVGVMITGTAQEPRVRLYSDPSLSETEKLSWLVLGRGPAGLGGADIGLLQTAASALLTGENGSPKDTVLSTIGLDTLSVQQHSSGDVQTTVVNVGKQISRHWYVGYERSLNATTGNWQLVYRLAQRLTLRAQAGADNALDLIWSWRFD